MDATAETADAIVAAAEQHLERGEPLLAYNDVQAGMLRWPEHARLRQLQALALARSGDVQRANGILEALVRDGVEDSETLGMLARTHKDLALNTAEPTLRASHLEAGFGLYQRAYESARRDKAIDAAWYTGINAATMALLRGDLARSREIARHVRDICGPAGAGKEPVASNYWREATLGEAALILGETESAATHYARAAGLAKGRYGDVSSTRRQARLLAAHLPGATIDVSAWLRIPPVMVFTGHMVDRPDRARQRFPQSLEAAVRGALRERLAAIAPLALYSSAACGADIIALELMRERGGETHVVLPFPLTEFRRVSVDFAQGDWGARFDRCLAEADSVTVTSDHHARDSTATFEYANLVLTGMGRLRAQMLDAPVRGLAVADLSDPGLAGGTASILRLWEQHEMTVDQVALSDLRSDRSDIAPLPQDLAPDVPVARVVRHEMRAMLFADAVGYSKLSEDQIPGYIEGFLGAVADLSRRTSHRFEHVETSGDGLYMVFGSAADAGHFALELSAVTNAFDRAAWGLPPTFGLRVALHCGPVHCGHDPITGLPIYTGPHTSRAARIEPITPPGQVYASSAFAAVAAASGERFAMNYVGRMPLPGTWKEAGESSGVPGEELVDAELPTECILDQSEQADYGDQAGTDAAQSQKPAINCVGLEQPQRQSGQDKGQSGIGFHDRRPG